jgi:hypothetical protein
VDLTGAGGQVSNAWPVWVYPPLGDLNPDLRIFDPAGLVADAGGWLDPAPRVADPGSLPAQAVLLAASWDSALADFLQEGGRALLHQQAPGDPFPAQRSPFWREATNLFYDHPLWDGFPHAGFTDLQFYGLASDRALISREIQAAVPGLYDVKPVLRRLDARQFTISDYLVEARLGAGRLLVCTLRLQGGAGGQPSGWARNVAGGALLRAMLDYLSH